MAYTKHQHLQGNGRGFTIVELIVVVLIIGVLVTIMVPVLSNRSAEARVTATKQELQHLGDAMERAHIQTNYMYRLDVLNDAIKFDNIANTDPANVQSGIRDSGITTNNLYGTQFPYTIFISLETQSFPPNQLELYQRLSRSETAFGWQGPYVNWHRDVNKNDWPDDPWGNDYLFFTINGMIYPPVDTPLTDQALGWQFRPTGPSVQVRDTNGNVTTRQFPAAYIFDRPTLLSLGPNGLPGNGTTATDDRYGKGDDLIYQFGSAGND
ncbi:prepilin-type N-terminal cleavage/methylation domain-containing protein [bacterium]|nr:prepilin-type N-terminal cleavage/methylation domain-containing protein [bacterium]